MIQRYSLRGLAAVVVLLITASVPGLQARGTGQQVQSTQPGPDSEKPRPRIALALSGGGALGMAHVGVLGVLEELHVPIDCIAGTSMGSIVGGLYATGLPAAGLEGLIEEQDWADVFVDRTAYRDLPFRRKEDERRYLVDLQLGLSQEGVALPSGLVTGQQLFFLLQRYALPVVEINDFSQLPIPFVTVATDLATGQPIILRSGDLASALRASMSIPGFFSPLELEVEFEGRREKRLLVDGGVVNNLPVQLAQQLCDADVVIAVDVTQPLASRDELQTQADITSQTLAFLTRIEVDRQLQHADVVISPELDDFGLFSFQDADTIVAAGAAGARAQADALAALGLDADAYLRHRAGQLHPPPPRIVPAYIRFDGSDRVDERTLRRQVRTRVAQPVDLDVLREDLGRLYNLNDFERVTFRLEEDNGEVGLVFLLEDKSLGQTYLQFGIELSSDLRGETGFTALINATRTRLNRYGAEWRSDLTLGDVHGVFSELYLPLGYATSFFVSPWLEIEQRLTPVFDGGRRIAEYDLETRFTGFDLGLRLGRVGEVRAGIIHGKAKADAVTGAVDLPEFDIDVGGVRLIAIVDDVDRPTWAREGWSLVGSYFNSLTELGASDAYERLEAYAAGFASHGDHTLGLIGGAGTDFDTGAPVYDNFSAGGAGSFVGLTQEQLSGPAFAKARFLYYYQFMTLSPTVGRGVFAGLVLDAGNYWQSLDAATLDDLRYGTGVFVGADTFLGPVLVGYGRTDDGQDEFYFTIGQQLSR